LIAAVPKFNRQSDKEFAQKLRQRISAYFDEKQISRNGDYRVVIKSLTMFALYFGPFVVILTQELVLWQYLIASLIMGVGVAGIGLAVMHDANHGSLSKYSWLNKLLGYSLNVIGGNSLSWRIQHNVLHHSFTNVKGLDEDLEAGKIMRFTPHEPWKERHRYQYIYAWLLYSLMTFSWVAVKDFSRITKYKNLGLLEAQGESYFRAMFTIAISKIFYLSYLIALPLFLGYNVWVVLSGFVLMHLVGGLLLAMIFQPAHVMEEHTFVDEGVDQLAGCYESHQLATTTNFGGNNPLLTWYCGGLNFQIEHHMFPSICHIHYPALSKIVKATAEEYGLTYRSIPTFGGALAVHQRTMKKLSSPDFVWA